MPPPVKLGEGHPRREGGEVWQWNVVLLAEGERAYRRLVGVLGMADHPA